MPQDKALLLKTAKVVSAQLKKRRDGTEMHVRLPSAVSATTTGGWRVVLGRLGKQGFRMEIWLDGFTGHDQRKFWFGFISPNVRALRRLAERLTKKLRPQWEITRDDFVSGKIVSLASPLRRERFGVASFEDYTNAWCFFGIYDLSVRTGGSAANLFLCERITEFMDSVARTLPGASTGKGDDYPRVENRRRVESHLRRDRSQFLASERKSMDRYVCQVCDMRFEDLYGKLGSVYAEAHHMIPLGKLDDRAQTRIEDLRTVCANCHRMLHRMDGKRDDFLILRRRVRRHQANKQSG